MVKKFTIPFASQGDANDIPDALQVDGKVSFTQGFGYDYERPYDDPQAKDIAREDMNGLFKAITSAVGELQTLGASGWSSAISYPKGAIVYYEKDLYISQVDDNQNEPPQNWVSITSIANDSLKKAANLSDLTNKTTARNNLGLGSSATLNKTDILGTSSNLVATQKLVNDTKINLESSKQDKLEFVGSGKVMREGAYGLGLGVNSISEFNSHDFAKEPGLKLVHVESVSKDDDTGLIAWSHVLNIIANAGSFAGQISIYGERLRVRRVGGGYKWFDVLTEKNTSTDSSGFLRASGNKETFTKDLVTQSTGSSTTSVMSQKAVTDRLNSIESSHGVGYGQKWIDVTSQRATGTTYTNSTGRPIMVAVTIATTNRRPGIIIDGVELTMSSTEGATVHNMIIPKDSTYMTRADIAKWSELR